MKFTHLDPKGNARQVPVQEKPVVYRRAKATGFIRLSDEVLQKIKSDSIAKGNVLAVARVAGISAAKKTADLIPLCHSLNLDHVGIDFEIKAHGICVTAEAAATAKTGVEMEALTAVQVTLLTIYDMCKAVDKNMYFENIRLIEKIKSKTPRKVILC
ncbi:MAG TPA: cyclic pyranopterin monophosphate synthase MoaC [Bdellovibrionota bacterium]|nr:cyclic pyranopterin monophosphate synthase MoaC [Bdellovibrionota bacterium]